ncbi:hypothetical protein R3P38DRAFT_3226493 [Favolaschia claudopus]|uniref:Uncharacterized protein n=1 Tax=Favolaschia claudopus TaxID=2862362 RepID=A0AAV9ZTL7_9AGAR
MILDPTLFDVSQSSKLFEAPADSDQHSDCVARTTRPQSQSSPLASLPHCIDSSMAQPSPRSRLPPVFHYDEQARFRSLDGIGDRRHSKPLNADAVAASLASGATPHVRASSLAASPSASASVSRATSYDPSRQTSPAPTPSTIPPSRSTQKSQNPPCATTSATYQ